MTPPFLPLMPRLSSIPWLAAALPALLGGIGGIELFKLRARRELGRWVQWLLGMFGGHLPGCNGGFELL